MAKGWYTPEDPRGNSLQRINLCRGGPRFNGPHNVRTLAVIYKPSLLICDAYLWDVLQAGGRYALVHNVSTVSVRAPFCTMNPSNDVEMEDPGQTQPMARNLGPGMQA